MALSGRERHSSRQVVFHNPVSTVVESLGRLDNDDNGESAAGGRLAHLLQILVCILSFCYYAKIVFSLLFNIFQDVKNVLVIVTRYFGGIHLGSDRFKHINQAARNALSLGGFLETLETRKGMGRGKKH